MKRRPHGVIGVGLACFQAAATGRIEHAPLEAEFPDDRVRRVSFEAGGGHGWRIQALETPRETPAPWKIVVITGAPSWSEYWAPALAACPDNREMIVVDRPGFAGSEPFDCVPDIRVQAEALAPVLKAAPGQRILLVGQSYGAAIATLMAEANPRKVASVVLLSSYLGVAGPTVRFLVGWGRHIMRLIPRDLRNAIYEISHQAEQLTYMRAALTRLKVPVHVIHGDMDDFAPIEIAEKLVAETHTRRPIRFQRIRGLKHFFNDGPAEPVIECLEACIPASESFKLRMPRMPKLDWRWPEAQASSKFMMSRSSS
ncbi:MAG TPA: alpha/beta hydrolase [Caulobacteraceae bacterium]|nr:alpha/beta hydrolase [Caulobacteraceae bacterium]